ncbi:MAG: ATP-binding protein [Gemmatimonadaceae bacterium]
MTRDIHAPYLPRLAESHLGAVLSAQPVAIVMGARQTGKSTLIAHADATAGMLRLTLDDLDTRQHALSDPEALVSRADRMAIDEVQRAPDLLIAIKREVDRDRRPGRFVLTGSANLLAMKPVQESLAGRASYVTLWPLTRRERLGLGSAGLWQALFDTPASGWRDLLMPASSHKASWQDTARQSNYPPVAVHHLTSDQQADWLQGYLDTFLARDVTELAAVGKPLDLLRLMRSACVSLGQPEHQAKWAETTGLPSSTVSRWTELLSITYQLVRVPAYSVNRTLRLTRKPKLYWSDTAMALQLAGNPEPTGAHLENIVLNDLQAWCSSRSQRPIVHHWRTATQREVDFVVELPNGLVLPIEVKATRTPGIGDTVGLRAFLDEYPDLASGGLLLYGGDEVISLGRGIIAAPWWSVV